MRAQVTEPRTAMGAELGAIDVFFAARRTVRHKETLRQRSALGQVFEPRPGVTQRFGLDRRVCCLDRGLQV